MYKSWSPVQFYGGDSDTSLYSFSEAEIQLPNAPIVSVECRLAVEGILVRKGELGPLGGECDRVECSGHCGPGGVSSNAPFHCVMIHTFYGFQNPLESGQLIKEVKRFIAGMTAHHPFRVVARLLYIGKAPYWK
ncbi:hypothetical protein CRG98_010355 [Punica granatum]|uniref:Uncharacterized protein n=1 Tax=Punica granatum TaxID=22663 RepID=A0A2I0KL28_PUNGR|nr:hypothetical protein CRG98_010355 [Punica granatum]